uniref:Secreted protein n=1 Tax=Macrostomum lignano TaxID=282301 RepID=A0A1I8G9M3_9PLAT
MNWSLIVSLYGLQRAVKCISCSSAISVIFGEILFIRRSSNDFLGVLALVKHIGKFIGVSTGFSETDFRNSSPQVGIHNCYLSGGLGGTQLCFRLRLHSRWPTFQET